MNISVDNSILENIKILEETDDEENADGCETNESFVEVFGGFGADRNVETNDANDENIDDPLESENEISTKRLQFQWICNENDFSNGHTHNEEDAQLRSRKNKRSRSCEFKSSNGTTWRKTPLSKPDIKDLPGFVPLGKGPAKSVSNPLEAWHLLVDVPMLNQVVRATNDVIRSAKGKEPYQKRSTDISEIKSWLGLHYLCGVLKNSCNSGPIEELWTLELGNAVFRATMAYNRFEFLSYSVRCVEKNTDTAFPLDEVAGLWEKLIINCRSYYSPSDFCVIDESLLDLGLSNMNPFVHTLPSQPNSTGLRIITKCDAKTMYISNALIANHSSPIDQEVYQIVSDIKGTRRCLCLTERFNSVDLCEKLSKFHIHVVGALAPTSPDVPCEVEDGSLVPRLWCTTNNCSLIGCLDKCIPPTFLLTNGLPARLNAVKLYDSVQNSNSKASKYMNTYSTKYARTERHTWILEFLYFMLDLSAFNSWILFRLSQNGISDIEQRDFQRQLGLYLTQSQLKQRMHLNIKLPVPLKLQIAEILGENVEPLLDVSRSKATAALKLGSIPVEKSSIPDGIIMHTRELDKRRRCRGCKSQNGSKIKTRCQQCLIPFCMRHLITRCEGCSNYQLPKPTQTDSPLSDTTMINP